MLILTTSPGGTRSIVDEAAEAQRGEATGNKPYSKTAAESRRRLGSSPTPVTGETQLRLALRAHLCVR